MFKNFFKRKFKTTEEAKYYGYVFVRNVYGDEINALNARSIWRRQNNVAYCDELHLERN